MKTRLKSNRALAALTALSALVAACGGGDGGTAPSSPPVAAPAPAPGPGPAVLPAGVADGGCGTGGRATIAAGAIAGVDEARAAQALAGGKLMLYGTIDNPTGTVDIQARYWSAMRLNEDCSVDTGYANHGRAYHAVSNPAYQVQDIHQVVSGPDGAAHLFGVSSQTYTAGTTSFPTQPAATMVRLQADGALDPSVATTHFQTNPASPYPDSISTVAATPLPDGGWLSLIQGGARSSWSLLRLKADGSLDTRFAVGGQLAVPDPAHSPYPSTFNSKLSGIATDASGRILVSGTFNTAGSYVCPAVMRLKADGSLDTGFGVAGVTTGECGSVDARTRVKVLDSGKILVASVGDVPGRYMGITVRRLNDDGALDLSYGVGGTARVDLDEGIAPGCDKSAYDKDRVSWAFDAVGNTYVGGTMYCLTSHDPDGLGTRWHGGVARLSADGVLDPSFGDRGRYNTLARAAGQDEVLRGLAFTADAKLVLFSTARKDGNSPSTWVVDRVR